MSQSEAERSANGHLPRFDYAVLLTENVAGVGLIATDIRAVIRYWNPGAEALLGYRAQEIEGRRLDQMFAPTARATGDDLAQRVIARHLGIFEDTVTLVSKSGQKRVLRLLIQPLLTEKTVLEGYAYVLRRPESVDSS